MSDTDVVYRERPGKLRLWFGVPWAAWAVLMIWSFWDHWARTGEVDVGAFLVLGPLFFAVFSIPGLVSYSKRRYHTITLTSRTLRVGRDALPVEGITLDPPDSGRPPRLVGGASGVPMGMREVILGGPGGERYLVATLDPEAFLAALGRVIPPASQG
ncbi:hypothetical protein GCM10023194_02290 [Planotetraspora phitsanulokensis]|uniref:Uncharacterized protein n=1 Tax=Planotetraspora phitsanulokensis TaxID=575192 RepID=A0A8J3U8Z7_9ACTN|nr:hypothetical protein [Planotetraspora phitsanulokensis]GII40495.1 hypothetical protein Pph01_54980 [Planotetraspora phitsanulokensis]